MMKARARDFLRSIGALLAVCVLGTATPAQNSPVQGPLKLRQVVTLIDSPFTMEPGGAFISEPVDVSGFDEVWLRLDAEGSPGFIWEGKWNELTGWFRLGATTQIDPGHSYLLTSLLRDLNSSTNLPAVERIAAEEVRLTLSFGPANSAPYLIDSLVLYLVKR